MKIKINFLQLVKLCFFAMLLYSSFLMELLEIRIANMTLALGVLTTVAMLVDMAVIYFNPLEVITHDVKRILLFTVCCAISALIVATYPKSSINGIVQLMQCLLLMVIAIYICIREGSLKFCSRTIVIVMAAAVIYTLLNAESLNERLALSEDGNANVFGHNAVLGLCLTPLLFENKTFVKRILQFALTILFATGVVFSASRMSFITLIGYCAFYLIIISPRSTKTSQFSRGVRFLGVLGVAIAAMGLIVPFLENTLIAERMEDLFAVLDTGEGDGMGRLYLYEEAWRSFLKAPLFGVGYANFAPLHGGVYTHSTYAEILSCTGLVGSLLFLSYYLYIFRMLKWGIQLDNKAQTETNHCLLMVFIVLLLLGVGEILIYKIKYFVVYGILAAQFYMNKKQARVLLTEQTAEGDK